MVSTTSKAAGYRKASSIKITAKNANCTVAAVSVDDIVDVEKELTKIIVDPKRRWPIGSEVAFWIDTEMRYFIFESGGFYWLIHVRDHRIVKRFQLDNSKRMKEAEW
jgi:hypothetical protein